MEKEEYAKFYTRARALLLDLFFIGLVLLAILFVSNVVLGIDKEGTYISSFFYVISFFYFTLLEASFLQGTFGKAIAKIKVVDNEGNRLSYKKSALRAIGKIISYPIMGIGYLLALVTKKNQAVQDKIASTYVIKYNDYSSIAKTDVQNMIITILSYIGKSIYYVLLAIFLISLIISALESETAKAIGNFIVLVLGAAIWIGIFYVGYKIKTSSLGQAFSNIASSLGSTFESSASEATENNEPEDNTEDEESTDKEKREFGVVEIIWKSFDAKDRRKTIYIENNIYSVNVDAMAMKTIRNQDFDRFKNDIERYYANIKDCQSIQINIS